MRPEDYIRHKIRQLLVEERLPVSREKTKRIGGGVRQEFPPNKMLLQAILQENAKLSTESALF